MGMTGYKMKGDALPKQQDLWTESSVSSLKEVIEKLKDWEKEDGRNLTFSGAELEYILYGSECEMSNQLYTCWTIYFIRFLLDAIPVSGNVEVQALASTSTFGYPIVMALELLVEPLVDTILMVNGAEVEFWKTSVYLTPSGLPGLIESLISFVKLNPEEKKNVVSNMLSAYGTSIEDYEGMTEEMKSYLDRIDPPKQATDNDSEFTAGMKKYQKEHQLSTESECRKDSSNLCIAEP